MPTTEAGKATSALNSIQHGILAQTAAIPGVERLEDWQAHRQGRRDSFHSPLGAPVASTCSLEKARELLDEAQRTHDLLQSFPSLPGDASLPLQDVSLIISAVDAVAQNVDAAERSFPSLPDEEEQ